MLKTIVIFVSLSFFASCGPKPCSDGVNKAFAAALALVDCKNYQNKKSDLDCTEQENKAQTACASAGSSENKTFNVDTAVKKI